MSEKRIDPTLTGLFLVAFVTSSFGLLGLEVYTGKDFGMSSAPTIALIAGIMIAVLMVSAIRYGDAFVAPLMGFVAISLIVVPFVGAGAMIILAVLYYAFVIAGILVKLPKLMVLLLTIVGTLYLVVGLGGLMGEDIFLLLQGILGLSAGTLALYISLALATQKLPMV